MGVRDRVRVGVRNWSYRFGVRAVTVRAMSITNGHPQARFLVFVIVFLVFVFVFLVCNLLESEAYKNTIQIQSYSSRGDIGMEQKERGKGGRGESRIGDETACDTTRPSQEKTRQDKA